ncbi:phosphoglycerate mutase family protein [Actinomycetospora lutea]|uniref:phosphoglycerate mutase family protein n=1 Tax=Actinomycetospora lutea TaxID=663604 RepID=UPI002365CA23|nr:phosphoglycerate mutase family protein [Actinomycetospora lutea]MDD7942626.1 phosphoglycerate mutase family protein [Actinomycetospora lutea]
MITVVAVRHADVAAPEAGGDPSLSPAGRRRAAALAHVVRDLVVDTVVVSSLRRTRETVAPVLDERPGLVPLVEDHPADLTEAVRGGDLGATVLVAGHSNTVPALVVALVGDPVSPIRATEFDRLTVLTVTDAGAVALSLRYGAAD